MCVEFSYKNAREFVNSQAYDEFKTKLTKARQENNIDKQIEILRVIFQWLKDRDQIVRYEEFISGENARELVEAYKCPVK